MLEWLNFAPETYPSCLGCSSYHFLLVRPKNVSVKFWRLFRAQTPSEEVKSKIGPAWLGFAPELYPHGSGCNCYHFSSIRLKELLVKFWQLFRAQTLLGKVKLKIGPGWLDFATKTYPDSVGYSSYYFPSVRLKNVSVKFWLLFWVRTPPKQAQSKQIWKLDPDDSVLYSKHAHTIWGAVLIVSC